jgi:hypothetical protein
MAETLFPVVGGPAPIPATLGQLLIETPPHLRGTRLTLPAPRVTIGREGTVALDSPQVSRLHALIWLDEGTFWLRDEDSANGTFLNGARLSRPHRLTDGDRIRCGDVVARFVAAGQNPQTNIPQPDAEAVAVGSLAEPRHARNQTTRYLAAATQLDRHYRRRILDLTVREGHRAVCPSYGVDLSVVARHAVAAERRELWRDAVLAGALMLVANVAIAIAIAWNSTSSPGRLLSIAAVALVISLAAVGLDVFTRLSIVARYLQEGGQPGALSVPPGRISSVLQTLAEVNSGNVIVFSIAQPFVGSGTPVDADSFTVPLLRENESSGITKAEPSKSLASSEVIQALENAFAGMGLPHLRVDARLYVDGHDVARFPELLPNPRLRPVAHAKMAMIRTAIRRPEGNVRPYLAIEFTSWQGQLVVTIFVRIVVLEGVLYVERAAYALAPLKASYYVVDEMLIATTRQRAVRALGCTLRDWLPALLASPYWLATAVRHRRRAAIREARHRHRVKQDLPIDYGASTSVREEASEPEHRCYFMKQDIQMQVQVVDQKMLDTIGELLRFHGYETGKIRHIQNTMTVHYINNGINNGAIGEGATTRNRGLRSGTDRSSSPDSNRSYPK